MTVHLLTPAVQVRILEIRARVPSPMLTHNKANDPLLGHYTGTQSLEGVVLGHNLSVMANSSSSYSQQDDEGGGGRGLGTGA